MGDLQKIEISAQYNSYIVQIVYGSRYEVVSKFIMNQFYTYWLASKPAFQINLTKPLLFSIHNLFLVNSGSFSFDNNKPGAILMALNNTVTGPPHSKQCQFILIHSLSALVSIRILLGETSSCAPCHGHHQ